MTQTAFPTIDLQATGENIIRLRKASGLTVRELQQYFGFEEPQAIYKWQQGKSLPSVDNLLALSILFGVSMNEILVQTAIQLNNKNNGQPQDCPFDFYIGVVRPLREQQDNNHFNHFLQLPSDIKNIIGKPLYKRKNNIMLVAKRRSSLRISVLKQERLLRKLMLDVKKNGY